MKKVLGIFAILLIIAFGIVLAQNYLKTKSILPFKGPTILISNQTFELKIARSQKEKEVGLSDTNSLSDNQGMLFVFDKPEHYSFWMKNMKFPIDIIYINNQEIVTIYENVKPPTSSTDNLNVYAPTEPADKVLEIKAGLSKKYNFKKGNKVTIENL